MSVYTDVESFVVVIFSLAQGFKSGEGKQLY